MLKQWRSLMLSKFGKQAKRSWSTAAIDFQLVDLGIKPTCLFDHWAVSADDMQSFTCNLHEQHLTNSKLNVISVGLDVFIYKSALGQHSLVNRSDYRLFVDISSSLQSPILADNDKIIITNNVFIKLCDTVTSISSTQDLTRLLDVEITENLNGPCLYGLLLGYPCVYWYDVTKGDEHCLSGQVLQLFQVIGRLKSHSMEDKPLDSESIIILSREQEKLNAKPCHSADCHVIFSFTVPVCLLSSVQDDVESWFQSWRDLVLWPHIFWDVWLEQKSVSPQSVCL